MTKFAEHMQAAVAEANGNLHGQSPAPWEVVMKYVAELEERVVKLEDKIFWLEQGKRP